MMTIKIKSFTDLDAWKEAHKLVLEIYAITETYPLKKNFSLVDQMRRSSLSVSSNIAEGFSRFSKKEKSLFYFIAKGSLTELQNQLIVCRDIKYTSEDNFQNLAKQTVRVHKLINGLIKSSYTKYDIPNTIYDL